MTKRRSTKRALLSSVVALLLCFSMLLGSTFAWFTDSAASGSNVITAGNLDIEVQYTLDGENWNNLDGADDLFQKGLWEPGHTEVVALKVKNNGSLALKYAANMNIIGDEIIGKTKVGNDIVLSDILTVSTLVQEANQIGDITVELAFDGENRVAYENNVKFKDSNVLRENVELLPGSAHYVFVKVDMAETVGNEANHNGIDIPKINFGINVLATQFTYENDSFDNKYDENAQYSGELSANGNIYALTGDSTVTDESFFANYTATEAYTINGNGHTVTGVATYVPEWEGVGNMPVNGIVFASENGAKATVNDITFTGNSQMIMSGYYNPENASNNYNSEFNNVKVVDIKATGSVNYEYFAMSVYGNAVMNNCTVKGTTVSTICEDHTTADVYDIAVVNGAKLIANNSSFGSIYTGKYGANGNFWGKAYVELNNSSADIIYACGRTNGGSTVINNGSIVNKIIANNAIGITLTIAEGAVVDTLDLTEITGDVSKSTIIIDGTVNHIIDNGNEYATIEEWKAAQ